MAANQEQLVADVTALLHAFRSASDWQDFAPLEWFASVLARHRIRRDGFDSKFLAALAYSGWFLFCAGSLTPKFHRRRMLVDVRGMNAVDAITRFDGLSTEAMPIKLKPLRKRLTQLLEADQNLVLQVAPDYRATVERINAFQRETHGRSWIEADFLEALCDLSDTPVQIDGSVVRTIAWDLRDAEHGELLAADIGYQVGAVYSSMSGFSDRRFSSLGVVQLFAQLEVMQSSGVAIWDLGMPMPYKYGLGAGEATGVQWLEVLHAFRSLVVSLPSKPTQLIALPELGQLHSYLVRVG